MTDKFSNLLSETINAPRLSGTKVKTLTELFTTSLDVSHITTFYKLNRSLPQGGQARISSLYVFDALSRGAKEGLKGKKKVEAKRCLDALEAVAESWVEGMTTSGGQAWVEGKDKARKIIDIWRKYEIFPPDTVDQLSARLTNTPLPVASGSRSTTPTYEPGGPPPISPALPPLELKGDVASVDMGGREKKSSGEGTNTSLPPDILKLLGLQGQGQAAAPNTNGHANAAGGTGQAELAAILARLPNSKPQSQSQSQNGITPPAGSISVGGLNIDPNQLAQLANIANKIKSPIPHSMPLPTLPIQHNGYPPMQSFGNFPPPQSQSQPQYQNQNPNQQPYPPQQQYQGQGQGHTSPQPPPGQSRNYGKVKPLKNPLAGLPSGSGALSPPPHNNYRQSQDMGSGSGSGWGNGNGNGSRSNDSGRERERGGWQRDRSKSPERNRDNGYGNRRSNPSYDQNQVQERERPPPPSRPIPTATPKIDLDSFDLTTFNPTDALSWATLGEAWKNSRGSEPSQMDLMGWMSEKMMEMGGGMGGAGGMGGGVGAGMNMGGGAGMGGGGGGGGWGGY